MKEFSPQSGIASTKRSWQNKPTRRARRTRETPKTIGWGEIGLDIFYDHSPGCAEVLFARQNGTRPPPPSYPSSSTAVLPDNTETLGTTRSP